MQWVFHQPKGRATQGLERVLERHGAEAPGAGDPAGRHGQGHSQSQRPAGSHYLAGVSARPRQQC